MLASILSYAIQGVVAEPVMIEVNTGECGIPDIRLVGLPDTSVKESVDRVSSAIGNSGYSMPHLRTTINLAPAHLRKEGPLYDLPIALGILAATGQFSADALDSYLIAGELGLSGRTRPVRGMLPMARLARRLGKTGVVVPAESAAEAALVEGIAVHAVASLDEAVGFFSGNYTLPRVAAAAVPKCRNAERAVAGDFAEIRGQGAVRRAVEVAVSGGHNLLIIGPPGSGKSMIAKRIPSIMPEPTAEEFLEILTIQSAAGRTLGQELPWGQRPFRSPHHTVSDVALLGGGAVPGPGEISLAHNGVLFLDELPEFKRSALEVMRQPLEDGQVTISRASGKATLPCGFMLVAAMNPCPCGHAGSPGMECRCTPTQVERYRARVSGPLLDRIDIQVEAPAVSVAELRGSAPAEGSAAIRGRIQEARAVQHRRLAGSGASSNARMSHALIREHCRLGSEEGELLQQAMERLHLSARAYDRILKVARTIADLAGAECIRAQHLLEAIHYRSLDRKLQR